MFAKPRRSTILPGFSAFLAYTLIYLGVVVLLPLIAMAGKTATMGFTEFARHACAARVLLAMRLSFTTALIAASISLMAGLAIAWALARYDFWGRRFIDSLIDLPFALPTAVTGIALSGIYGPFGIIGAMLAGAGLHAAYNSTGIIIAMVFVGLPFVVRSLQPVLEELESEVEEAAMSLGASRWQTVRLVILPSLRPALVSGTIMAFSRALGEYGSVIFIAGNIPLKTEIAPLVIVTKLEQHDVAGATAVAALMLASSFLLLLIVNSIHNRHKRSLA